MRELAFALEYVPGCNRVADALAEHPGTRLRSLSLHATPTELWRVDHASGDREALTAVEAAVADRDHYADCLVSDDCGASGTTRVLEHTDSALVVYSRWERGPDCVSVPHLALEHLGDGVLFDTRREGRHYTWRIVHPGEGGTDAFFDALEVAVGDCADLEMLRTSGAGAYEDAAALPAEQRAAVLAAVEHGYNESPREIDLGE
jgi:predicted DNA binding protein